MAAVATTCCNLAKMVGRRACSQKVPRHMYFPIIFVMNKFWKKSKVCFASGCDVQTRRNKRCSSLLHEWSRKRHRCYRQPYTEWDKEWVVKETNPFELFAISDRQFGGSAIYRATVPNIPNHSNMWFTILSINGRKKIFFFATHSNYKGPKIQNYFFHLQLWTDWSSARVTLPSIIQRMWPVGISTSSMPGMSCSAMKKWGAGTSIGKSSILKTTYFEHIPGLSEYYL